MADNILAKDMDVRPIAADDIYGVMYQRCKVVWGADNAVNDTSAAAPMPVTAVVTSQSAGTNLVGDTGVQYRANATGAATKFHLVSANTTNATVVKASAGRLVGYGIYNDNAATRCVKFHNQATTPTAGSGVVLSMPIPPKWRAEMSIDGGISFATGIAITTVTEIADNGTTAVGTGDLTIDLYYA